MEEIEFTNLGSRLIFAKADFYKKIMVKSINGDQIAHIELSKQECRQLAEFLLKVSEE